jgi:LytS/YehU family sensor histidine kinase
MLIENAVKHNIVSNAEPLHIEIYIENDQSIVVKNNLQLKTMVTHSTKTGLENIKRRYQLLSNRTIDIISTTKNFMVALPLLKVEKTVKEIAVA